MSTSPTPAASSGTSSPASITVQVLLFSVLRDRVGTPELSIDLPTPATGDDLLDELADRYPDVADYRSTIRLAVNQEYVPSGTALSHGDEVALITPVSGG